jgi:hypothetical protein
MRWNGRGGGEREAIIEEEWKGARMGVDGGSARWGRPGRDRKNGFN